MYNQCIHHLPNDSNYKLLFDSLKEAYRILEKDGVIIIFPAGAISTKETLKRKEKAIDSEWKQFVSKLCIKTQSPVLPMYFEGQNSHLFHVANKMGQIFITGFPYAIEIEGDKPTKAEAQQILKIVERLDDIIIELEDESPYNFSDDNLDNFSIRDYS